MKNKLKSIAPVIAGGLAVAAMVATPFVAANQVEVYATQGSTFTVTIPKTIILDGQKGEGAYSVDVKGNIGGQDLITVTPDATFLMKQAGKEDVSTAVTQAVTEFNYAGGVTEVKDAHQLETGAIKMASITAGKWAGQFNFAITSTVDTSAVNSVGSVTEDITNETKVGKDTTQVKESVYGEADVTTESSEDSE